MITGLFRWGSFFSVPFMAGTLDAAEIVNLSSSQSSRHVVVEYDLVSEAPVMVNVEITVQGVSYPQEKLTLEGDVARHIKPGKRRRFIWDAKRDFPKWPNLEVTVQSKVQPK